MLLILDISFIYSKLFIVHKYYQIKDATNIGFEYERARKSLLVSSEI
jgi:hypothetical protein